MDVGRRKKLFGQQDILTSMNGHFTPHCIALHCSRQRHFLNTAIYATIVEMIGKLNHTDHMEMREDEIEVEHEHEIFLEPMWK